MSRRSNTTGPGAVKQSPPVSKMMHALSVIIEFARYFKGARSLLSTCPGPDNADVDNILTISRLP